MSQDSLGSALRSTVDEGVLRLTRRTPALLATGLVGGIDVSLGVLAALLVTHETGNEVLGGLAFTIGFIALALANSELFTENFLVPIAALAAGKARPRQIARHWTGTAVMNLVGGALVMWLVMLAFPETSGEAAEKGAEFLERGISVEAFASAVLAGMVITVMTWMQEGSDSIGGRIVAAFMAAFILKFGSLSHVIVASLDVFAGVFGGDSDYDLLDWASQAWFWALGNAVGGIGFVTVLRLIQIGPARLHAEQHRESPTDEDNESVAHRRHSPRDDDSDPTAD